MLHPDRQGGKALIDRIRAMGERLGYQALVVQSNLRRDGIAASLRCPTLVIGADADPLRSAKETRELVDAIPGAELRVIERCGHLVVLEQPDALAKAIWSWLAPSEAG